MPAGDGVLCGAADLVGSVEICTTSSSSVGGRGRRVVAHTTEGRNSYIEK